MRHLPDLGVIAAFVSAWSAWQSRSARNDASVLADAALLAQLAAVKAEIAAAKAEVEVAAEVARIASVQVSQQTADESKHARQIGFDVAPVRSGQSGWLLRNDSDSSVSKVEVRTTTGARLAVYRDAGTQQVTQLDIQTLGANQSTQLSFRPVRPAGTATALLDATEIDQLQVTFID